MKLNAETNYATGARPHMGIEQATRPSAELEMIFEAMMRVNNRLLDLTNRAECAVSRIGGSWPVAARDTEAAPDRDGIAPAMAAVVGYINETLDRLEDAVSRAEKL